MSGTNNDVDYFVVDVSISMEHLVLAATDLGLGTCWIGRFNEEKVKEVSTQKPKDIVSEKLSKKVILKLQERLTELGYNPGPIDGIWGKKTETALKKFQEDNSLPVTGKLDEATKEKLDL